jgi:hypothetical protein
MDKVTLTTRILRELGDSDKKIWSSGEVDTYLSLGLREMLQSLRLVWDWSYLENLPGTFSHTFRWEEPFAMYVVGTGNYTYEEEFEYQTIREHSGPINHTAIFEAVFLGDAGANESIPATSELPSYVTEIDRATWDMATIEAFSPYHLERADTRYEITKGEVFGYTLQKDGLNTFRKVRVPSEMSEMYEFHGSWGIPRGLEDLGDSEVDGEPPDGPVVAVWGIARRIPGHFAFGGGTWGTPRSAYSDHRNVRVEHWRQADISEIPERYAVYLKDYAKYKCLVRQGAGQDFKLAAHFRIKWERALARIKKRLDWIQSHKTGRLGGTQAEAGRRPPRPRLPWQYGQRVR